LIQFKLIACAEYNYLYNIKGLWKENDWREKHNFFAIIVNCFFKLII